ncbi:COX15/CtaA family protein [Caldimonas sp. KR1-144]|uniref:COX15/CtaA family protein n=1 Tax=Caldimonas sp. KR1-144 TaxID=3400911 RepID=UPI003C0FBD17
MDATPLYNFEPLLHMALLGVVIALGPLAWWWVRHRGVDGARRGHALVLLTLFLTFDLVLFGAFTRLTDSGLGCPDWPGCYGSASPLGASDEIQAAQTAQPTGPVTHGKAWVEMVHRYLATGVGVLITVAMALAWLQWRRDRRSLATALWASATFVWVCVQGAFGAFTVTLKLYPAIVTAHLLGGLVLLALLAAQGAAPRRGEVAVSARLRAAMVALAALATVQIALGGWVSTNYAVLACSDFPTCQGQWWPAAMDFEHGFSILRPLGTGKGGEGFLPFAALTAIHMTHRIGAVVVLATMLALAVALGRVPSLRRFAAGLLLVALWQLASGVSNVVLGWPLVAAVAHTGGAAALTIVMTTLLVRTRREPAAVAAWDAAAVAPQSRS